MKEKPYAMPTDDYGIHMAADAGVQYQTYQPFMNQAFLSGKEWAKVLHVSERTLQRIREEKRPLDMDASERLLEVNRLFKHGEELFGTMERFVIWINRNIYSMGGHRPIDLMSTLAGLRMVRQQLGRIEHGIVS